MADGVLEGGGIGGGNVAGNAGVACREDALDEAGVGRGLSTTRSEYVELAGVSALGISDTALLATLGGGGGGAGGESEVVCFLFPAWPGFSAGIRTVVRPVAPDNACAGPLACPEEAAPDEDEADCSGT